MAVDEGSEIIRTAILASADLHDSQPSAQLIRGDEHAVYGGKAYAPQGLRDRLAEAGIADGQMYRAARNKPAEAVAELVQRFNKALGAIRAAVERRFGIMKRGYGSYGFRRVRYIGLVRNAATPAICTCCAPPSTSSVRWRLPHDVSESVRSKSKWGRVSKVVEIVGWRNFRA